MAKLTRKNLMVDAEAIRQLAHERGTSESEAVRNAVAHQLAWQGMAKAITELHELGAAVREVAYQDVAWRMIFALSVRAGRYDVVAARGAGLQGIGGNYRVGLEVDFD